VPTPALPVSRPFEPHEKLVVSLEFTNVCNFKCPFCPQAYEDLPMQPGGSPYDRKHGFMSRAVFDRAVAECRHVARIVELGFFGEQTLHPLYLDFMSTLASRPFQLETNTNVSMVTHDMMRAWITSKFDLVRLSLDAITPEVFNIARPGPVRSLTTGKIVPDADRMSAVNEKVHAWLAMPDHRPTRLVYVNSSYNQGEKQKFIDYWTPYLGPSDHVLIKQVLSYGGKIIDPLIESHRCNVWDVKYLVIDNTGATSPCNLDTNMDLALGSIMEQSVEQLYFGERAQWLKSRTGCGNPLTPCRTCTDGNNWSKNEKHGRASACASGEQLVQLRVA